MTDLLDVGNKRRWRWMSFWSGKNNKSFGALGIPLATKREIDYGTS
jgi:hypothetical protein